MNSMLVETNTLKTLPMRAQKEMGSMLLGSGGKGILVLRWQKF